MTAPFGANPGDNASIDETAVATELLREILEAVCARDGISLDSDVDPGSPARNYELALRLRIGHVFGIGDARA